ncbi:DinB family protein [Actinotalea sp. M2MS4P-6]|uniref:DinB family protein n=1 Tax=Actinotalea sp. M2MS4P-6 TaxID=2983762 RepID=UPI0021E37E6A|nr:DinB family protein [Actinotalea sp. M2MS4P-6]MCV2395253.1 DinB family protein [Actinotalea sp. M2MS4P-6]
MTPQTPERWTRAQQYPDTWVDPAEDPRESQRPLVTERDVLVEYLRRYRLTLELKCADLSAEDLARRSVPPSTLSLLGLVRHLSEVERGWFRRTMAGLDAPPHFYSKDDPDGDFDNAKPDPALVDQAWQAWREEVAFAEGFVADHDLDHEGVTGVRLREVVVHLIEEYARHAGHADLLRERIDGRVGQ